MCCVPWTMNYDFEFWPRGQVNDFCKQIPVQAVTFLSLIYGMRVDQLKRMCHVSQLMTFHVELWSQGQSNDSVSVFWCSLLIFGIREDQLKMICHIPWLVTLDHELWHQGLINDPCITVLCIGCNDFCMINWMCCARQMYRIFTTPGPTETDDI